jgi:Domain of unknown function (DUF6438)
MNIKTGLMLILSAFMFASCSSLPPTIDNDTLVKLEQTACYGECPVFQVGVKKDGTVVFEGIEYVASKGLHTKTLSKEKLDQIEIALKSAKFTSFRSNLDTGTWGCISYKTDHSRIIIEASINNKRKAVLTYLGCNSKQVDDVIDLSKKIETIIGLSEWVEVKE